MKVGLMLLIVLSVSIFIFAVDSKTLDPYKVLGVEKSATQREIQKAFHKLSLQYHPDKNKKKGAQEKFAQINNAYEILSDDEKRKNYDLYGDEKGNPGFDTGGAGDHRGYTYFTSGGQGNSGFSFRPDEWQNMGGHRQSNSFSFSFGGPSEESPFGFGLNDIFSSFFGGGQSYHSQFGGGSSTKFQSGSRSSPKSIMDLNSQTFEKEVADKGITWLLLSYSPKLRENQQYERIIADVVNSLEGAIKAGSINCEHEQSFCKALGIYPRRAPRVFVYSYRASDGGSLLEYNGDLDARNLKTFCQDHLPKFSKRVDLGHFDFTSGEVGGRPRVMLISAKKDTPVIWRAISGLRHRRFIFYDAGVHDVSDPLLNKLGVDALPAIVGWLPNGEKHILKAGISVKNIKSAVHDLSVLLDAFESKAKKTASSQTKNPKADPVEKNMPIITRSNFDSLCDETVPVCLIGAFRSFRAREKLESILLKVSQKSLLRRQNRASSSRDSVSYALLDANKQSNFLNAFDGAGYQSSDMILMAYKPRRGKYAAYTGKMTIEEAERFISSVLNGDVHFSAVWRKPTLK